MKRIKKQVLSLLLAVVMLAALAPLSASAVRGRIGSKASTLRRKPRLGQKNAPADAH